ncbi:MAG: hypothetical protein ACYDB7_03220 [Mycobacteriales bacterium]
MVDAAGNGGPVPLIIDGRRFVGAIHVRSIRRTGAVDIVLDFTCVVAQPADRQGWHPPDRVRDLPRPSQMRLAAITDSIGLSLL